MLLPRGELLAILPLAFAVSMRMLGLFLLLPVLAPYVASMSGGSLSLAGLAVGVYGFTQAFMQIPLGWLSDRIGRKPVIVGGLLVFAAGGVLAGAAGSATAVIAGRALQGAGAISAAVLAGVADITSDRHSSQGMAIVGVGIAVSFALAIMLAGPLATLFGVDGLLTGTAVLGLAGAILVLCATLPAQAHVQRGMSRLREPTSMVLLCVAVFLAHAAMGALFVYVPTVTATELGGGGEWRLYLPAFLLSLVFAVPVIVRSSRSPLVLCAAAGALAASLPATTVLSADSQLWLAGLSLTVFFASFNMLEAVMPAQAARLAGRSSRGSAMGAYSVCQALGAFTGAALLGVIGLERAVEFMSVIGLSLAGTGIFFYINKSGKVA